MQLMVIVRCFIRNSPKATGPEKTTDDAVVGLIDQTGEIKNFKLFNSICPKN